MLGNVIMIFTVLIIIFRCLNCLGGTVIHVGQRYPITSIKAGVNAAKPGDTVLVDSGSYNERIIVSTKGTGPNGMVIIKSSKQRAAQCNGFDLSGAEYVQIDGFEVTNFSPNYTCGIGVTGSNIIVSNNYIHDGYQGIIGSGKISNTINISVSNNYIYKVAYGILVIGTNWVVENNDIKRLVNLKPNDDADYMRLFGDSIIIRGNYCHGTKREECPNAHIDGCQTFDNASGWLRNVIIEKNVFRDFDQGLMFSEQLTDTSMYNILVCNNIFMNGLSFGISNNGVRNMDVYHNLFVNIKAHGVVYGCGATGNVKNNMFIDIQNSYFQNDDSSKIEGMKNVLFKSRQVHLKNNDIINIDPKLYSISMNANVPFIIDTSSICAGRGTYVGVKDDIWGRIRDTNNIDIGPFKAVKTLNLPKNSGIRPQIK